MQLAHRVGYHKTLVAIANKHARIIWALLARGETFQREAVPLLRILTRELRIERQDVITGQTGAARTWLTLRPQFWPTNE